jgi:glycosyltransferase involved in cell wall biosynthesis
MLELASDGALQRRLIASGRARSEQFSWKNSADKTWRVLDAVAGTNS